MEFNTNGKVAVVTGSSRGLGYAFAQSLILGGAARVYINSRKQDACNEAVKSLTKYAQEHNKQTEIFAVAAPLHNTEGVIKLVEGVIAHGSKTIDILIANAGASWGEELETHPEQGISKVLDLNVKGVFLTIQKFLPLLKKPLGEDIDPSRVLITASIAGLYTSSNSHTYGYVASKAGVIHLGKQLALQLPQKYNINVNVLAPGFFPSKMANGLLSTLGDTYVQENPRKRLGKNDDLLPIILFLCDKRTNYLNGVVLPIDGGYHNLGPNL